MHLRLPIIVSFTAAALLARTAPTWAEEPTPPSSTAPTLPALDPNDPLFRALQELQRDVDDVRKSLDAPNMNGGRMSPPPAMARPPRGQMAPTMKSPAQSTSAAATQSPPRPAVAKKMDWWSFQPLRRPAVPQVGAADARNTAVDRFLLAKLEPAGLAIHDEADPYTLCRRLYFDLTGLPPTPAELERFVSEFSLSPRLPVSQSRAEDKETGRQGDREAAYTALVDRLLASPRFGERWGRHWLDVVRFGESAGRSWNAPFTYAWRYRDYVIDAFNRDTPFDRFILEQLAGDLLPAGDDAERRTNLIATGMLGLASIELRAESHEMFLMDQIDDQIDVTTRAFMGLTVSCARCHDHKYDPVSMHDYYALAGIFYSSQTYTGQGHQGDLGPGGYVDPDRLIRMPSTTGGAARSSGVIGIHSMSDFQSAWSRDRKVRYATDPDLAMAVVDGEIRDCPIRIKGEPYDRGESPARGDLGISGLPPLPPIANDASGRLQLARWIASTDNPLTARVAANRVWLHLFGRGLAATVDDFGTTGETPTHPELLDWLAVELVEGSGPQPHAWSMKQLIRTLVLSRAYRASSTMTALDRDRDPQNALYGRMSIRRLQWEPLRDSMLSAAGRLTFERPDGIQVNGMGGKSGTAATHSLLTIDAPYRTVYLPVLRSLVPAEYDMFDFPNPTQIMGRREVTTVATQALFFMNSDFAVECASDAAAKLLDAVNADGSPLDDAGRVRQSYLRLFGREPQSEETTASLQLLNELDAGDATAQYRWTALVQALMAGAEFRYVR